MLETFRCWWSNVFFSEKIIKWSVCTALKTKSMPKCCVRSVGKVKAQTRLVLDKGLTEGEEQGRASGTAFTSWLSKQGGTAAFPMLPYTSGTGTGHSPIPFGESKR